MSWADDQVAVTALLNRYARAVDTGDWKLYRSVFTADAQIDYSSAGAISGSRDEVVDWFTENWGLIAWSMHYITNVEADVDGDTAAVRAMFYNPFQIRGLPEQSTCGGYYHHELVRTADGWASRSLREQSVWFVNKPGQPSLSD